MSGINYVSIFSGVEAATVAAEPLGWNPVCFCEIDEFPSAVLNFRWSDVPNLGDITKVDWKEIFHGTTIDVVVGGSPCQSFSVAGKREGLDGESGLMFEYIRAVREIRPRAFVWENVTGALSSEHGAAFGQLLSEMDELGYDCAWRVLDAQFFGVAQRRRRVFLVGIIGGGGLAGEVLLEREGLRWDPPSSRDKRKELAGRAGEGPATGRGPICVAGNQRGEASINGDGTIHPSLSAAKSGKQFAAIVCMADDNAKAAIDDDMCGSLKVGGGSPMIATAIPSAPSAPGTSRESETSTSARGR